MLWAHGGSRPVFMISCGIRRSRFRQRSFLAERFASGTTNSSASPLIMAESWPGIRTILIGRELNLWLISPAGLAWTIRPARTAACSTLPGVIVGRIYPSRDLPATWMQSAQFWTTSKEREFERPVAVELKKGEASFHHPRLVHGSFANHSERSRRATVINVMKDGVRSGSNEPLLHGVPVIPPGQKIEGQFFPLLSESRNQV